MVKAEQISVEVVERRDDPGVWSVEAINTDGSIEVALFPGPNSKDRATEYAAWRYELAEAADTITALRAENEQYQRSFDLRWDATMRAIKRWQEAHPGNDLNWPDHADLVVWLLERDAASSGSPAPR